MEELIQALQKIGFSLYEAKTYLALLQASPSTGYEISRRSGVPQAKVYETISRLVRLGAVQALASEPVRYVPLPPEILLQQYREDFHHSLAILQDGLPPLLDKQPDYLWNIAGYDGLVGHARDIIGNSREEILLSIWTEEAEALSDVLTAAAEQIPVLRGMLFGDAVIPGVGDLYRHGGEEQLRRQAGGRWIVVAADKKEALVGQIGEDGGSMAIRTVNPGIVFITRRYINHELFIAKRQGPME